MTNKKCQVFTPEFYGKELLNNVDYQGPSILEKVFLENSVGEGNILILAVEEYIKEARKQNISNEQIKQQLEKYFVAFEIDKSIIIKCKKRLDDLVSFYNIFNVKWNIKNENYLFYKDKINADYIVGNPPYIRYTDIEEDERKKLKERFISCSVGKFDYCYAFIERSLEDLNTSTGKMSYFIPSSIFKNTFGSKLRQIMLKDIFRIIDFQHRNVFGKALTSPAIIGFEKKSYNQVLEYIGIDTNSHININKKYFKDKWIFSEPNIKVSSSKLLRFGDFFQVNNSVATLLNEAFVIKGNSEVDIENEVLRDAASPRGIANKQKEKIIFPYYFDKSGYWKRYDENEFILKFPGAVQHLKRYSNKLSNRKADGLWFEYGRTQALRHLNKEKLLISSIITDKLRVNKLPKDVIPYSGFFITTISTFSLNKAVEILESYEFENYILNQAINANGKSVRISVNDIKNFTFEK